MTAPSNPAEVGALIAWLRKRGEPDSGMDYRSSNSWQDAVVRLHGTAADFVAKHFHGQGARDLADALETLYASPPIGDTGGVGLLVAEANYRVGNPSAWDSYDEGASEIIRQLLAALVPARVEAVDHIADAGKMVEPSYADLRAVIEQSRDRVVAGGGWSLSGKEADTALEWVTFLEGIGAPCPKISGFDEGLQLVWDDGKARHYLALGSTDEDSFVMKLDRSALQANPS